MSINVPTKVRWSHIMAYIFGVIPLRPEVGGVVKLEVLSFT
jgi:hypothetical protein